jgi:hypothetical protein
MVKNPNVSIPQITPHTHRITPNSKILVNSDSEGYITFYVDGINIGTTLFTSNAYPLRAAIATEGGDGTVVPVEIIFSPAAAGPTGLTGSRTNWIYRLYGPNRSDRQNGLYR